MILRFIGAAETLKRSTIAALVDTDQYLSQGSIPDYVTSYFDDKVRLIVNKSSNSDSYVVTTQVTFNTIIFYINEVTPIGYCILNSRIDMGYLGITQLSIDLSYVNINSDVNALVNISTTNYQPHNTTNMHPKVSEVAATKSKLPKKYKRTSLISSSFQDAILNGGLTRICGDLCKGNYVYKVTELKESISDNPLDKLVYKITDDPNSYEYEFRYWTLNNLPVIYEGLNGATPEIELTYNEVTYSYDYDNDSDFSGHSNRLFIPFRNHIVKIFDAETNNSEYWIYNISAMIASGTGNLCDGTDGLVAKYSGSVGYGTFGLTRNLFTNEISYYYKNNGKIEKVYPIELERLIFDLHLSSAIHNCSILWGYTNSCIIYSNYDSSNNLHTFLSTDAPINKQSKVELPINITKVEAISNKAFLIYDDNIWRLIKLIPGDGGYSMKTYYLGNHSDGWRKLDYIITIPQVIEHEGYSTVVNPIFTPVDGRICGLIDSQNNPIIIV